MKIENNCVVRFHYSVNEPGLPVSESSFERDPIAIVIGHGNVIPGMEQTLLGREAGDRFEVTLTPEQAYGAREDGRSQRLPRKHFGNLRLQPGQQVTLNTRFGPRPVTVSKVGVSVVDVDLNHPMAGKTLHFDIEIVEVRAASKAEIAHKHAHGNGGHDHNQ